MSVKKPDNRKNEAGHDPGCRNCENPRPKDVGRHSPPYRLEPLHAAHTDERPRDSVRGRYRQPQLRGQQNGAGRSRFRAESRPRLLSFVSLLPIVWTIRQPP